MAENNFDDTTPMTKDELAKLVKVHATPIDYETLTEEGVLEKKGDWYAVLDWDRLPDHAKRKAVELKGDEQKTLSEGGLLMKFTEANPNLLEMARKRGLDV